MSLEIKVLQNHQASALEELFRVVWGDQKNHAAHIQWALQTNPLGHAPIIIAVDEEKIVASRASMRWPIQDPNRSLAFYQFTGTCVHPDYRRIGLFTKTNQFFLDWFENSSDEQRRIFTVSVDASRRGYEKLGWNYIPGFRRHIRVAGWRSFARKLRRAPRDLRGQQKLIFSSSESKLTPYGVLDKLNQIREEQLNGLYHTSYRQEVFNWRFAMEQQAYRDMFLPGIGWCVYKLMRRGVFIEVEIGDVWLYRKSFWALKKLCAAIIARDKPDLFTVVLSSGHPYRTLFYQNGFLPDPRGDLNFGIYQQNDRVSDIADLKNWAVMTEVLDTF